MRTLSSQLLREIGSIARAVVTRSDALFKTSGLQKGQFIFLTRVRENPGINLAKLSDLASVDKTTTTKAVQKLSALGFLSSSADEADGRSRRLFVTEKALAVYDALIDEENAMLQACFSGFTDDERRAAEKTLARISGNVDAARRASKQGRQKADDSNSR